MTVRRAADASVTKTAANILLRKMNMIQIKSTAFKETALLVLVLFLSGCAATLPPTIVKKTAPRLKRLNEKSVPVKKGRYS